MQAEQISDLIKSHITDAMVEVNGEGCNFDLLVVSDEFIDKKTLQRQQLIYTVLNPLISSGELHAVNMRTLTRAEWSNMNLE